jgi:uncharacterized phiE125 gp8 family phage protein
MGVSLIAAAASAPVDLEEVKLWCKIETDADDAIVEMLISAAAEQVQAFLGKAINEQTWLITLPSLVDVVELHPGPVIEVLSIKYLDVDRVQQTLDPAFYIEDTISVPARLVRDPDQTFPQTASSSIPNVVEIEFNAGPEVADPRVKAAIMAAVAQWYDNRIPGALPTGVVQMLQPLRRIIL